MLEKTQSEKLNNDQAIYKFASEEINHIFNRKDVDMMKYM